MKRKNFPTNSIEKCIEKNRELRSMTDRRFWTPIVDDPVSAGLIKNEWMSIRSYVFAFEAEGTVAQNPEEFAQRIADVSARLGSPVHLHGIFVAGQGYYVMRAIDVRKAKPEDYFHVGYTTTQPLAAFKWSLIQSLARFPRSKRAGRQQSISIIKASIIRTKRFGRCAHPSGLTNYLLIHHRHRSSATVSPRIYSSTARLLWPTVLWTGP